MVQDLTLMRSQPLPIPSGKCLSPARPTYLPGTNSPLGQRGPQLVWHRRALHRGLQEGRVDASIVLDGGPDEVAYRYK